MCKAFIFQPWLFYCSDVQTKAVRPPASAEPFSATSHASGASGFRDSSEGFHQSDKQDVDVVWDASLLPSVLRTKAALSFFNNELVERDCSLNIEPFLATVISCAILTAVVEGPEACWERLRSSIPPKSDTKVSFNILAY